jgi:hypothetical protein
VKAQSAVAAAVALMAVAMSGPVQAADSKSNDNLEWALAHKLVSATMSHALRSTYSRPTLLVVQNACQWESAMATLSASGSLAYGADAAPTVDWKNQMVVVVAMGQMPYGYDLNVRECRQSEGKLLVDVHVDYTSYENNLEDESPVAVLVVDGRGMNKVRAMYDMDLPTLVSHANAPSCGAAHGGPALGSADGGLNSAPSLAVTWGSLKASYR